MRVCWSCQASLLSTACLCIRLLVCRPICTPAKARSKSCGDVDEANNEILSSLFLVFVRSTHSHINMGNTASTPSNTSLPERHAPVASSSSASPPAGCPMHQEDAGNQAAQANTARDEPTFLERLNPLNNIPLLSQAPVSPSQQTVLSLERTVSSIPRASSNSSSDAASPAGACPVAHDSKGKQKAADQDEEDKWVYPSPQQFYNALMRKGKDTPEQSIDVMVHIHNFLNERAWDEVRRWEDMRTPGERIELARFEGRPQDLSPKARFHLLLGNIFSNTYR